MPSKTPTYNYIYTFKYDYHHTELCKLESRQIFHEEEENRLLFSNTKVDPSISPFIKNRFEIIISSDSYSRLMMSIKEEHIQIDGFKVEYMVLDGDVITYKERLQKLKEIGFCIEGEPDYSTPSIIYSICNYENTWYFGVLNKHDTGWHKHKAKPRSFSNSIHMNIAKSLVGIASKGNKTDLLLDACCGVGTVMLEACFVDVKIEGCDINWKSCNQARENLAYYNYTAKVYCSDIKDVCKKYDAAIIDLPYNLYSNSSDAITLNIIASTAKLTSRIVIVSISDIEALIKKSGLIVSDFCTVVKRGKSTFARNIWVCERNNEDVNSDAISKQPN